VREKRFYQVYLSILLQPKLSPVAQSIPLDQTESESEEESLSPQLSRVESQPLGKPKADGYPKRLIAQYHQLMRNDSGVTDDIESIGKMIELAKEITGLNMVYDESENIEKFLEIRLKLIETIQQYFAHHSDLDSVKLLYLEACKYQLISLSDAFIIHIIQSNQHEILKEILSIEPISETRRLQSSESEKEDYTMMEWAVFYKSFDCCNWLMSNGYSFDDYQLDPSSPITSISESPEMAAEFHMLVNSNKHYKRDLILRTMRLLSDEIENASMSDSSVPLKKIQLEGLRLQLRMENIFANKPNYRIGIHSHLTLQCEVLAKGYLTPARKNEINNDVGVQRSIADAIEAKIEFLGAMKPQYVNLLKVLNNSASTIKMDALKALSTASTEEIRRAMIKYFQNTTAKFDLYTEILRSGTVQSVRQDGWFVFNPKGKKMGFIERLEAFKREEGSDVSEEGEFELSLLTRQLRNTFKSFDAADQEEYLSSALPLLTSFVKDAVKEIQPQASAASAQPVRKIRTSERK